jgi:hypothetical protein
VKAFRGRTGWRVKPRLRPGEQGRLSLALHVPDDEAAAQARADLLTELLDGMRQANQPADLLEDVAKKLCSLPAGDELAAHVRFVRTKLCTGAYTRADKSMTVRQLGEAWTSGKLAREHKDHVKAKRSSDQDERHLRLYVYDQIGDVPVVAVTLEHLETVMQALPEHLGAASRRHVAQVMASLLKLAAYPLKLLRASPVPKGFLPRVPRSTFTFLYPSEEARRVAVDPDEDRRERAARVRDLPRRDGGPRRDEGRRRDEEGPAREQHAPDDLRPDRQRPCGPLRSGRGT